LSGVGDAAEQGRGAGDYRALFGAEGTQLFVEPGVALCPGSAGEFVAVRGGDEEYFAAVARVAGADGVAG
jgi:hypothetical protein